jgi:hypothetical protein
MQHTPVAFPGDSGTGLMSHIRAFEWRVGHLLQFGHGYARISGRRPTVAAIAAGVALHVPFKSADEIHNAERWEMIRRDISHRLRGVCVDLTAPEFLLLVNSMVAMQLKGEVRKNRLFEPQ